MTPLLQYVVDSHLEATGFADEETKKYELPMRMLKMLTEELISSGHDIPTLQRGDVLHLTLAGIGDVELTAATVH